MWDTMVGVQPLEKIPLIKWSTPAKLRRWCVFLFPTVKIAAASKGGGGRKSSLLPNFNPRVKSKSCLKQTATGSFFNVLSTLYCNYKPWPKRGEAIYLSRILIQVVSYLLLFNEIFHVLQNTILQQRKCTSETHALYNTGSTCKHHFFLDEVT